MLEEKRFFKSAFKFFFGKKPQIGRRPKKGILNLKLLFLNGPHTWARIEANFLYKFSSEYKFICLENLSSNYYLKTKFLKSFELRTAQKISRIA